MPRPAKRKSLPPVHFLLGDTPFSVAVLTLRVRENGALEYGLMLRQPYAIRPTRGGALTCPWRYLNPTRGEKLNTVMAYWNLPRKEAPPHG